MIRATRSARLKRLHEALSEGEPVSLNALIEVAGGDHASVVGDLRHLRSDLGAPLRFSDGGYRYLSEFELPVLAVCLQQYELQSSVVSEGPELVWSAQHLELDYPVQVRAMLGGAEIAHHMEVRSRTLARLAHPAILPIYDRGRIDEDTANESNGQFERDMRWLALSADYETDLTTYRASSWKRLLQSLVSLLDALAYAHAHDVYLLRALPAQVLATSDHRELALSHLIPAGQMDAFLLPDLVGACFQAPERNADWHRPPTVREDLYALGSLIWFLIGGEIPHGQARGVQDLLELQNGGDPTSLPSEFPLPKGFRNWLAMMRHPDASARFRTVADCRASLLEVDRLRGAQRWQPVRATLPGRWQRSWSLQPTSMEHILGLNLISLRPMPFVARQRERDQLWAGVHEAIEGETVSGCVVRSAAGVGKSRLLGWLKHRVVETGAGQVVRVRCNPSEAPGAATSALILQALEVTDVEPRQSDVIAALNTAGVVSRYEQDALASMIAAPHGWADWPQIRFERSDDRYAVVARLLARLSVHQALVIVVDDAQWSLEVAAIFRQLLMTEALKKPRVFFALAVRTEKDDSTSAVEERQLEDLIQHRRVRVVELERLRQADLEELVHKRLGMVQGLAEKAVEWCAGSPMMAHQLIESWHTEGQLVPSAEGIAHRQLEQIALPTDFARLWTKRLDQVLADLSESDRTITRWALEAGALLGRSVDQAEWRGMCRQLGFDAPRGGVDLAVSAGLLWPTEAGWRFQHGTLRDALLLESKTEGRLADLHRAIAEHLRSGADQDLGTKLRCGEHLVAAGDHQVAFETLLAAEALAREAKDDLAAERAIELASQAADAFSADGGLHQLNLLGRRAELHRLRGEWSEAQAVARELEDLAVEVGEQAQLMVALRVQGQAAFATADYSGASDLALRWQVVAQDLSDHEQMIRCELLLGMIFGAQSDWNQAISFYESARRRIHQHCPDQHALLAETLAALGTIHQERRDLSKALPMFIKALQYFEKCGGQRGLASVANSLADVARHKGRTDRALEWYARSKRVYESIGAWETNIVRLNLALMMMFEDRYDEAHDEVMACFEAFENGGHEIWLAVSYAFTLPGLAHQEAWVAFDEALDEAQARLERLSFADTDLARVLEMAGELASRSEEARRADRCFEQAAEQWRTLDCPAEANAAALRAGVH